MFYLSFRRMKKWKYSFYVRGLDFKRVFIETKFFSAIFKPLTIDRRSTLGDTPKRRATGHNINKLLDRCTNKIIKYSFINFLNECCRNFTTKLPHLEIYHTWNHQRSSRFFGNLSKDFKLKKKKKKKKKTELKTFYWFSKLRKEDFHSVLALQTFNTFFLETAFFSTISAW